MQYLHQPQLVNRQGFDQTIRRGVLRVSSNLDMRRLSVATPTPTDDDQSDDELVRLNIGGQSFWLFPSDILSNAPGSRLAAFVILSPKDRAKACDSFLQSTEEYFFRRSAFYFWPILDFVITGQLHRPPGGCNKRFVDELNYWKIHPKMPMCCDVILGEELPEDIMEPPDQFKDKRFAKIRRAVWNVTEGMTPSIWWQAFAITSNAAVIISLMTLILGTMEQFQTAAGNSSALLNGSETINSDDDETPHPILVNIETLCLIYFSLEYGVRLLVAPEKGPFLREALNMVDLLAVVPFLLEQSLSALGVSLTQMSRVRWLFLLTRILRVLRVLRVAKLGRHSRGMRNFASTLGRSREQLQMVLIVVVAGVLFFSTLVYYCEKDVPSTHFTSIPAAAWWCIVTMTTVGYGDVVPGTALGKLVGSGAIVCGVMVLALPITIIVNNFVHVVKLNS